MKYLGLTLLGEHHNLLKQAMHRQLLCWHLLIFVVLFFSLVEKSVLGAGDGESLSNSVPVTFESFLTNPPVIEYAEYEISNTPPAQVAIEEVERRHPGAHVRLILNFLCTLRLDGTNYILAHPNRDTYWGRFGSTKWFLMARLLRFADMRMNTEDAAETAVGGINSIQQVRMLLNLGIRMRPNTIRWTSGTNTFNARWDPQDINAEINNGQIVVNLDYVNGVPVTAMTRDPSGALTEIKYIYNHNFYNGMLPVEFNVAAIGPGKVSTELSSLRIKALTLSRSHIDTQELDPRIALKGKYNGFIFLSNNVAYGMNRNQQTYAVMSAVQAQQNAAHLKEQKLAQRHPYAGNGVRALLITFILIPPAVFLLKRFRQGSKRN